MKRRRRNPDVNWLLWGAVAVGVYFIYKTFIGAKNVVINAQSAAGSSLADAAQFILGTGKATPGTTYDVHMPDGSVQTVAYGQLPVPPAQYIAPPNPIWNSLDVGASGGG
jgi:hypothetical protein